MIKIVAIVGLIITGAGHDRHPLHVARTARTPTSPICGTTAVCSRTASWASSPASRSPSFAFVGIELVGTAAAEAKDPEKNLPQGHQLHPGPRPALLRGRPGRRSCPSPRGAPSSPPAARSSACSRSPGLGIAASVINFVVLTSAASSANSGIYSTSRMVYGLAQEGDAPAVRQAHLPQGPAERPVPLLHLPARRCCHARRGRLGHRGVHASSPPSRLAAASCSSGPSS